jgi:hypothetical protein
MLNSISWQQYVVAVILITAAWYAYVGLRYYQPEISALLKFKPKTHSVIPEVAHSVMGSAQPEVGTSLNDPEELIFSMATSDDISEATLPKGPADDLLAEAESLISAFEESDDKKGFLSLLKILISKYEIFADEISLPQVIDALKTKKLPFTITANEWPLTFES